MSTEKHPQEVVISTTEFLEFKDRIAELEETLRLVSAYAPEFVTDNEEFYLPAKTVKEVRRVIGLPQLVRIPEELGD